MAESRRSRRRGERTVRDGARIARPKWRDLVNPFEPLRLLDEERLEAVHQASLRILRDLGLEFMSEEALDILAREGADVDRSTQIVRFDPALVEAWVAKAPSEYRLHARNPDHDRIMGGRHVSFALASSAPNVSCLDHGRRPGTYEDQTNLLKLAQSLDSIHVSGTTPVEAMDLPADSRHLDLYRAYLVLTDRLFGARAIGRARIRDAHEMVCIVRGIDRDQLAREPSVMTNINVNSPRRVDAEMLGGLMEMAENGQPTTVTPFTLAGAMSPITLAGSLAQQNAEALGVIAFSQMVRPGSPVNYGGFTSNVDMKSGAPAFGTPEYVQGQIVGGQLARRYSLPYRSSNTNSANSVDAQAAFESQMSIWGALMGGANLLYHGAGWLEAGLCLSYEKLIVDADMLAMAAEMMQPLEVSEATLGIDAIADVGVGGHFFGTAHTLERFESAFHTPMVSDWRNYEQWSEAGAPGTATHANRVWKQLLAEYEEPGLDPAVVEEVDAFVARRKEEIGRVGLSD